MKTSILLLLMMGTLGCGKKPEGGGGGITYYGKGPMCRPGKSHKMVCMPENPEPADVPAIQEKHACHHFYRDQCSMAEVAACGGYCGDSYKEWTCADKKRVLLTSVDGSIHVCHKVNQ